MKQTLLQILTWIKWKWSKIPACIVCGDDLQSPEEVRHHHCPQCWPTYLRNLEPPFVKEAPKEVRPFGNPGSK